MQDIFKVLRGVSKLFNENYHNSWKQFAGTFFETFCSFFKGIKKCDIWKVNYNVYLFCSWSVANFLVFPKIEGMYIVPKFVVSRASGYQFQFVNCVLKFCCCHARIVLKFTKVCLMMLNGKTQPSFSQTPLKEVHWIMNCEIKPDFRRM